MLKKFLSALLCFAVAFTVTISAFAQSGNVDVRAESVPLYLRYYYDQLSSNEKSALLKLRSAIIDCDKKITFESSPNNLKSGDEYSRLLSILSSYDPLAFNLDRWSWTYYTSKKCEIEFKYFYQKSTYKAMTAAYEKKVDKILDKIPDGMSDYKKIKTIHDSIVNTATYDLTTDNCGNLYGALVEKRAKCAGYAYTFSYICSKAGIKSIYVIGDTYPIEKNSPGHAWNKVYYNKKWYNIDVTWDDPTVNLKDNLIYDYFMIDDKTISRDHFETDNYGFTVPAANDSSKAYYKVNKKYATSLADAKSIIKSSMKTAVKKNATVINFQCSSKSVYNKVLNYLGGNEVFDTFHQVKGSTNKNLIDYLYYYNDDNQYTITVVLFYEKTSLNKYFVNTSDLDSFTLDYLRSYGIK